MPLDYSFDRVAINEGTNSEELKLDGALSQKRTTRGNNNEL
jgi:hypothetical protein